MLFIAKSVTSEITEKHIDVRNAKAYTQILPGRQKNLNKSDDISHEKN